jgi:hypothetical protein
LLTVEATEYGGGPMINDPKELLRECRKELQAFSDAMDLMPDSVAELLVRIDAYFTALTMSAPGAETPETDAFTRNRDWSQRQFPDVQELLDHARSLERRLREAEAYNKQAWDRYPTAWAYEQVCKARDEWQRRAEAAEKRKRK